MKLLKKLFIIFNWKEKLRNYIKVFYLMLEIILNDFLIIKEE